MKKTFMFIVMSLGLNLSLACAGEDDRIVVASESEDFLELEVGFLTNRSISISKDKFAAHMQEEALSVDSVWIFNVRRVEGVFTDGIAFSAVINGVSYHNIECDVSTDDNDSRIQFQDCGNDELYFQNENIVIPYSIIS